MYSPKIQAHRPFVESHVPCFGDWRLQDPYRLTGGDPTKPAGSHIVPTPHSASGHKQGVRHVMQTAGRLVAGSLKNLWSHWPRGCCKIPALPRQVRGTKVNPWRSHEVPRLSDSELSMRKGI